MRQNYSRVTVRVRQDVLGAIRSVADRELRSVAKQIEKTLQDTYARTGGTVTPLVRAVDNPDADRCTECYELPCVCSLGGPKRGP